MTKKFISWNVNGLRACVGKGTFYEFLQKEDPDALCLQETKLQEGQIEMDLPGFKKDEIKASLENGYLTITAEKGLEKDQKEEEGKKYICRERYSGSCQRTFYVGDEIEQDDIKASFKHGILRLDIPKKQPKPQVEEKKCISIEG